MEKQMDKRLKIGLIFAILVVVAIFATIWVFIESQHHFQVFNKEEPPA